MEGKWVQWRKKKFLTSTFPFHYDPGTNHIKALLPMYATHFWYSIQKGYIGKGVNTREPANYSGLVLLDLPE